MPRSPKPDGFASFVAKRQAKLSEADKQKRLAVVAAAKQYAAAKAPAKQ